MNDINVLDTSIKLSVLNKDNYALIIVENYNNF